MQQLDQPISEHAPIEQFETQTRAAIQRVRHSLSKALAETGADVRRPQLAAKQFKLGINIVWRAFQVAAADDALAAIQHVPGPAARRALFRSIKDAGGRPETIREAQTALEDFDRLVDTHADDRETFVRMLSGLPGERQVERDEAQRKLAFQGNSAIWGISAEVGLCSTVLTPGSNPDMLDFSIVTGVVGMQWLRANVPWPQTWADYNKDRQVAAPVPSMEPVEPGPDPLSPLMREFSTADLPPLRRTVDSDGVVRHELFGATVGKTGRCTSIAAWTNRAAMHRWSVPEERGGRINYYSTTPVKTILFDLFAHQSVPFVTDPSIEMKGMLPYGRRGIRESVIPVAERATAYPAGQLDLTSPDYPAYPRIMERVFAHLGRDMSEYRAFRFRIGYPPHTSALSYKYVLPENA